MCRNGATARPFARISDLPNDRFVIYIVTLSRPLIFRSGTRCVAPRLLARGAVQAVRRTGALRNQTYVRVTPGAQQSHRSGCRPRKRKRDHSRALDARFMAMMRNASAHADSNGCIANADARRPPAASPPERYRVGASSRQRSPRAAVFAEEVGWPGGKVLESVSPTSSTVSMD